MKDILIFITTHQFRFLDNITSDVFFYNNIILNSLKIYHNHLAFYNPAQT